MNLKTIQISLFAYNTPMKRLFLGLPLPPEQKEEIQAFLEPYRIHPSLKNAKWVPPENFHLTTLFLGEVPEILVPEIQALAKAVCAKMPLFTLHPKRISLFPEKGMAKMIWLKFERSLEFQELCNELLRFIKPSLPDLEVKESIAHLTLARFRTHIPGESLHFKPINISPFEVKESILFESTKNGENPIYIDFEHYPHDLR